MGKFSRIELVRVGGFDLQRYGSLRKFEEQWIAEKIAEYSNREADIAMSVAREIMAHDGINEDEAIGVIEALDLGSNGSKFAAALKYGDILEPLKNLATVRDGLPGEIVAFTLDNRLPDGWLSDNAAALKADLGLDVDDLEVPEKGWSEAEGYLLQTTITAIYEFFLNERLGWQSLLATNEPGAEPEPQTLGEESGPLVSGSPPTGTPSGRRSKPKESPTLSSIEIDLTSVPAI